jgi:hypothetical protein
MSTSAARYRVGQSNAAITPFASVIGNVRMNSPGVTQAANHKLPLESGNDTMYVNTLPKVAIALIRTAIPSTAVNRFKYARTIYSSDTEDTIAPRIWQPMTRLKNALIETRRVAEAVILIVKILAKVGFPSILHSDVIRLFVPPSCDTSIRE